MLMLPPDCFFPSAVQGRVLYPASVGVYKTVLDRARK